jgi:hypothetical protein
MHRFDDRHDFSQGIRNDQSSEPLLGVVSLERDTSTSQTYFSPSTPGAAFIGNPNDRVGPSEGLFQLGHYWGNL